MSAAASRTRHALLALANSARPSGEAIDPARSVGTSLTPQPGQSVRRRTGGGATSGSIEVLLELMANGADSDQVATHLKCCHEPGTSDGNDEFTLSVAQGAGSLATRVR